MAKAMKELFDVRLVERTREELAYKVMTDMLEGRAIVFDEKPTKDQYLDLYAECLEAVSGDRQRRAARTRRTTRTKA